MSFENVKYDLILHRSFYTSRDTCVYFKLNLGMRTNSFLFFLDNMSLII